MKNPKDPLFRFFSRGYPKIISPGDIPKKKRKDTYFCSKCYKWHLTYSNIGNTHKDYKSTTNPPITFAVTRGGKTFTQTRDIDPEYMRKIGKKGFAVTAAKIERMVKDPKQDPDKVLNLMRYLHQRIRLTTDTYRKLYSRIRDDRLRQGYSGQKAHDVASKAIKKVWEERKSNPRIMASELKEGDYFKYRETSQIEHYVQKVDGRRKRIIEIDNRLRESSIPFSIYVWKIDRKTNPIESYIAKGNMIVEGKPQYRGHFIIATGFMIRQSKNVLRRRAYRVFSHIPEGIRKANIVAFAFESAKLRDGYLNKILTKLRGKYIIKNVKGRWYFTEKD